MERRQKMTRSVLSLLFAFGLTGIATGAQAAEACVRVDRVQQISMTGTDTASLHDKDGNVYGITFSAPCGARHSGVFFVLHWENMPTCIGKGVNLPTNSEGVCLIKSLRSAS
jgi:hypothetical protein